MKKLVALLLFAPLMFASCQEDDKDYYNPVEGEWKVAYSNGDVETIYFTSKFRTGGFLRNKDGKVIDTWSHGHYEINQHRIYYVDYASKTFNEYKLYEDGTILQLIDPTHGRSKEYYRLD